MEDTTLIDFEDAKLRAGDHMVRGTAADGMIRAFALTARQVVQTAHENHRTSPLVTAALGRLMMGALMMGAMFKEPDELITLMVEGDGPVGGLTVTANCEGQVKGFANNPNVWLPLKPNGKLDVGAGVGAGTLTAIRDLPHTEPYSSQVELVSGEIGDDLTHYFTVSDQVPSSVGVGVLVGRTQDVAQAGGFIIQLMPGYDDYLVDELEDNLAGITSVTGMLEEGLSPNDMLQRILAGLDYHETECMPVEFYCGCNEERASRATAALGPMILQEMIDEGETAEVYCHFCGKYHYIPVDQLKEMLEQ